MLIRLLQAIKLTVPDTTEVRHTPRCKVVSLHLNEPMCRRSEDLCLTAMVGRSESKG